VTMTSEPGVEIELKYRIREASAADRYLAADEIGGFTPTTPTRSQQLEDRYLDTADGALARAGFAARLRLSARGTIVSLKSISRRPGAGGAHRREELEGPADRTAGPRDWPASAARSLILEQAGDAPLVELVTVRQLRRKRKLEADGATVELSIDEVDVVARSQVVQRFVELEVELVRGEESALAPIEEVLAADGALEASSTSKLDAALAAIKSNGWKRGRRGIIVPVEPEPEPEPETAAASPDAAEPQAPEPRVESVGEGEDDQRAETKAAEAKAAEAKAAEAKAETRPEPPRLVVGKTPGVQADDHLAEAGRKVLRFHLARMLAREAATRDGRDPEDLHAMRVASRRQRAAWRVFGSAFRKGRTRPHRRHLRELAQRLGAVRDLDVLIEQADEYRADLPVTEQRALEPLLAGWRMHRDDARVLLVRELDSDGYKRWIDDYRDFVRTEGAAVLPVGPTEPHRIRDTAASRILEAYEQVRAYEPVLRWADVETLHDLRIAGKWLRYTMEFVREPLGAESGVLIERVTGLQDHLGLMHDADVAAHLSRDFLVENAGSMSQLESAAIGRYLLNREREVVRLQRSIGPSWRRVSGISFRRALGRTLAGL
jgi:CHAD domain-containing protein